MRTDGLLNDLRRIETGHGFSGTVLVTEAGQPVLEAHFGLADRAAGTPPGPRTRFALGSVTKVFTAAAVLRLAAEGLDLDAAVAAILPPGRRPATLRPDVTVRHLLAHTSGIADYFEEETATADWADEFAALWRDRPVYRFLVPGDYLGLFGDLAPYRAPGERFQYSNAGYLLLGLVVEELTGEPYAEAVAARVFSPAGMGDSGFFAADEVRPDIAPGYLPPRMPGGPWRTNVFAVPAVGGADGGSLATAADLDRFLTAFAAGELVPPPLLEEALRPHGDGTMGLGVHLIGTGRTRSFGVQGLDPGAEAFIAHYPELGVNTVVLSNVNGSAGKVERRLREAVRAD